MLKTITVLLAIAMVVGGTLYGCDQSRRSYYEAMNSCTSHGGSWVPIGSNTNNDAACIFGGPKQ